MIRECESCGAFINPTQSSMCEECYTKAHGMKGGVPTYKVFQQKKKEISQILTQAGMMMAMMEASAKRHIEALRRIEYICINEPSAIEAATKCADIAKTAWTGEAGSVTDRKDAD